MLSTECLWFSVSTLPPPYPYATPFTPHGAVTVGVSILILLSFT